jgi:hypothetical protein
MIKRRKVEAVTTTIRLPVDIKKWLEKQIERSGTSQNEEMLKAIRDHMAKSKASGPRASAAS